MITRYCVLVSLILLALTASAQEPTLIMPTGHASEIVSTDLHNKGDKIITGSYDGLVKVWNAITGKKLIDLFEYSKGVSVVKFSDDGTIMFTASARGEFDFWDAYTGKKLNEFAVTEEDNYVTAVLFSKQKKHVYIGYENGTIHCVDKALSGG
jgi:WD40 repeat protein